MVVLRCVLADNPRPQSVYDASVYVVRCPCCSDSPPSLSLCNISQVSLLQNLLLRDLWQKSIPPPRPQHPSYTPLPASLHHHRIHPSLHASFLYPVAAPWSAPIAASLIGRWRRLDARARGAGSCRWCSSAEVPALGGLARQGGRWWGWEDGAGPMGGGIL